jgi:hypothetical protein
MILKRFLRYFLTVVIVTIVTALFEKLFANLIIAPVDRKHFGELLLTLLPAKFITYNFYLFVYKVNNRTNIMVVQGLVCLLFEFAFFNLLGALFVGLTTRDITIAFFLGLCSLIIPFLHSYLTNLLGLRSDHNH